MAKSSIHLPDAHVLVVDDDPGFQFLISTLLGRAGIQTASAYAAAEGLHLLEQEGFHLLVLDWTLPDMDGFELLEILRQDTQFDDLPVLMLSGRADPDIIDKALELGVDSYLTKPCFPRKLKQQIIDMLTQRRRPTSFSSADVLD